MYTATPDGHQGAVAEWLCSGLQSRVRRFDSDPRLHLPFVFDLEYWQAMTRGPGGGIGRHWRLKISCSKERAGSSPAPGTNDL